MKNQLQIANFIEVEELKEHLRMYILNAIKKNIESFKKSYWDRNISYSKVARFLELDRADVSKFMQSKAKWSIEKMLMVAKKLGVKIKIELGDTKKKRTFEMNRD